MSKKPAPSKRSTMHPPSQKRPAPASSRAKRVARPRATATKGRSAPSAERRLSARVFFVDAFTGRLFHGNSAAVVLVSELPDEDAMQHVAAEFNQPMTAFVAGDGPGRVIRWFTPTIEMPLCGHATIAAAHVLWNHEKVKAPKLTFKARAGALPVTRRDDLIVLDFPAQSLESAVITGDLVQALGRRPSELFRAKVGGNLMAVFDNKREIHEIAPDFALMARLGPGIAVTAPGAGHDFVSRFFHPAAGIPEDAASGSPHCMMVPYWAERLGKSVLRAHQVSRRGGELFCVNKGKRVEIAGRAVTFMAGKLTVAAPGT